MAADDFKTIPDELLHVAADAETHFRNQGYVVSIEDREIGFPFTPALVCRRGHEMVIVEVSSNLDQKRTDRWLRYCRSRTSDSRFCAVLRSLSGVNQQTMNFAVDNRLGLCVHDDKILLEVRAPADLAVQIALPELIDLNPAVRPLLAPAFQKVREGDWRDGLGHAYLEVEQHARDYLRDGINAGRIVATRQRRNQLVPYTAADIERMTLGQLKNAYTGIQNQTHKDALIGTTLAMIHETRDGLAHGRRTAAVEAQLRAQVGQNMYAAITCLDELTS
jgi:hypothetical protein